MLWIEFRDHGTSTRFETDDRDNASELLRNVVLDPAAQLIDFSYDLDGVLDDTLRRLESVRIGYPVSEAV
jgi:hypothetical protein